MDLGTHTGWATLIDGVEASGVWLLAKPKELKAQKAERKDRRNDLRVTRLFDRIADLHRDARFDWLYFEDVAFLSTQLQSQLWAGLRSAVWLQGRDASLQLDCVPVGTLKKFATGHGNATKEQMVAAHPPELRITDDNIADALHLLHFARQKLGVQ